MMESLTPELDSLPSTPAPEIPLTVSPADTSLSSPEPKVEPLDDEDDEEEKKPTKKRKSWGQELPVPKTNLPPRYDIVPRGFDCRH